MKLTTEYKALLRKGERDAEIISRTYAHYEAELEAAKGDVIVYHNDETGVSLWSIVALNDKTKSLWSLSDSDWLYSFPTRERAIEFAKRQGWNIVNVSVDRSASLRKAP